MNLIANTTLPVFNRRMKYGYCNFYEMGTIGFCITNGMADVQFF